MSGPDSRPSRPWCVFRIGPRCFAIDLAVVAEVIEADPLVRLPLSPTGVLGLCTFRREVVPVVALVEPFGDAPPDQGLGQTILVLRTEHGAWGVRIERGGTMVVEAPLDESAAGASEPGATPVLLGAIRREGVTCPALDPERTWRRLREAMERAYGAGIDPGWPGPIPDTDSNATIPRLPGGTNGP